MRIAFLSLFLFSASIFVSPLPTAVSSETATLYHSDFTAAVPDNKVYRNTACYIVIDEDGDPVLRAKVAIRYKKDAKGRVRPETLQYYDSVLRWIAPAEGGPAKGGGKTGYYIKIEYFGDKKYFFETGSKLEY